MEVGENGWRWVKVGPEVNETGWRWRKVVGGGGNWVEVGESEWRWVKVGRGGGGD